MVNWNSGYVFNGTQKGFLWNAPQLIVIVNVREYFALEEGFGERLVNLILSDKSAQVYETLLNEALINKLTPDKFLVKDVKAVGMRMIQIAESLGIEEEFTSLIVNAFIKDQTTIIDEAKQFANFIVNEDVTISDIPTVEALLALMDSAGVKDLKGALQAIMAFSEYGLMTDREPRTAVSDFMIGAIDDYDRAYDWLIPFDLKIDWNNTKLQVMPEAELTKIQMPGVDGSIIEDSVYKDRLFEIVAFSDQGLSQRQKEELKTKIARVLDATKHQDKKLTVQASDGSFDVRYEGQAEITDMPSYVKVKIPLRTPPYGYDAFSNELEGNGLVSNVDGDAPLRVVHTISGGITNPSFEFCEKQYVWNGEIPDNSSLVINHEMQTCYLVDEFGIKRNALSKLQGDFQSIPAGKSTVLTADENTVDKIYTEWRTKILW